MKKLLLSLFLLLGTLATQAQDAEWRVGFVGSFDFYSFNLRNPDPLVNHELETPLNYTVGIQGCHSFSPRFSLNLGIFGSRKGFDLTYRHTAANPNNPPLPQETSYRSYYLEVPVLGEYNYLYNPHLQLFVSAGLVPSVFVDDSEETIYPDEEAFETSFLNTAPNKFLLSARISTGVHYEIADRKSIRIEPYYQPYFSKVDKNWMNGNTSTWGILIGIYQHF